MLVCAHFTHFASFLAGEIDLIFKPGFVKGNRYLEEELRLERLNSTMAVDTDDRYVQGDTDWTVQAVVDEDQL